ncbi:MAG: 50S ribosomal protein L9, partial [Sinomonas sp.]|nr:50S ribosomal protein L9 [Sinomonas sp.]
VRTEAVASAVEAAGLVSVDKRKVVLPGHIKATGNYDVTVRLHDEVTATINLQVVAAK